MAEQIRELCEFLGISGTPQNFSELIPWLLVVIVSMAVTLGIFSMLKYISTLNRRL